MEQDVKYKLIVCDCCGAKYRIENYEKLSQSDKLIKSKYVRIALPNIRYGDKYYSSVCLDICQDCAENLFHYLLHRYNFECPEWGYAKITDKEREKQWRDI